MTDTGRAISSLYCHPTTTPGLLRHYVPRNDSGKGSPEGFPSAGGLGVSPSFKKSPNTGGYRGFIETISAVSIC